MTVLPLLRQDLRRLLPWTALLCGLSIFASVADFLFKVPDTQIWAERLPSLREFESADLFLYAAVLSYGGFPRESDEGSLPFLLSLPIGRVWIAVSKVAAALLSLLSVVVLSEVLRAVTHWANPTSFDGRTFRWDWQLTVLALYVGTGWVAVGYWQLLTVLRRLGVAVGLVALLAIHVSAMFHPELSVLDPTRLTLASFDGSEMVVSWGPMVAHVTAATLAMALSGVFWVGPGWSWLRARTTPFSAVLVGFGAFVLGTFFFNAVWPETDSTTEGPSQTRSTSHVGTPRNTAPATLFTQRFEFRFPEWTRPQVERLALRADAIHDRLASRLGVVPREDRRVVVDLGRSSRTHGGSTTWQTIRLNHTLVQDEARLALVFAHEVTHAVDMLASRQQGEAYADAVAFFSEGLAEVLSLQVAGDGEADAGTHTTYGDTVRSLELEAALFDRDFHVTFPELARRAAFVQRYGAEAMYPLSFVWVRAALSECGDAILPQLFAALGSETTPQALGPEQLWTYLMQTAGCNLPRVNASFHERLKQLREVNSAVLASFPRIVGGAAQPGSAEVHVLARLELSEEGRLLGNTLREALPIADAGADGSTYSISVRTHDGFRGDRFFATPHADGTLVFSVPEELAVNGLLEFQWSIHKPIQGTPIRWSSPWRSTRVR